MLKIKIKIKFLPFNATHVQTELPSDKVNESDFQHFIFFYGIAYTECHLLYCMFLCDKRQPSVFDIYGELFFR